MSRRLAFTLIETILAVALMSVVLGAVAGIYLFATVRLSDAYTKSLLYDQTLDVADRIESTVRNATDCGTLDGGMTLQCVMPEDGIDMDGDGHNDAYYPDGVDSKGSATYSAGNTVWFYNADSSGVYGIGSGQVWRAEKSKPGSINASNIDRSFSSYSSTVLRHPLVTALAFAVDTAGREVTFTVTSSTRIGAAKATTSADPSSGRTLTISRTVYWRN